jgi:hypothetical protein
VLRAAQAKKFPQWKFSRNFLPELPAAPEKRLQGKAVSGWQTTLCEAIREKTPFSGGEGRKNACNHFILWYIGPL